MSAGYSKRSLVDKLGIKAGFKVLFVDAPTHYNKTLQPLPDDVEIFKKPAQPLDFIQLFTKSREKLERQFPILKNSLFAHGMLWVSWPKKASKVETDVTEGVVRETGLKNGLVDVKICAVDEVWSGLTFVYRVEDRK